MEVTFIDVVVSLVVLVVTVVLCKIIESILRTPRVPGIKDKYVLVTGCDSGFGNLVTHQLDDLGVHVFAACFTKKGQDDLDSQTSDRVITCHLDVTDHASVQRAFEFVKSRLPNKQGLWGLVNNAGVSNVPGPIGWLNKGIYENIFRVNYFGVVDVTITFLPLLKNARGRVVNIASALSRLSLGSGGYAETKYAVQSFSDTLRRESKALDYGIDVCILEPGYFVTPLTNVNTFSKWITATWEDLSEERKAEYQPGTLERNIQGKVSFVNFVASNDLTLVTNAMVHALLSRWPKTRYACGLDMRVLFLPLSYAPSWFQDWFMLCAMKKIIRFFSSNQNSSR